MISRLILTIYIALFVTTADSFAKDEIGSLLSPGELCSAHARYEGLLNCAKCHKLGEGVPDEKCLECHIKLAKRITEKQGLHSTYTEPCIKCHRDHKGRDYKPVSLDEKVFNHDLTGYPLKDRHAPLDCKKCHKKEGKFADISKECASCHEHIHKGQLDKDCSRCHNFKGWKDLERFNHGRDSRYPLQGKHSDVRCEKCHPNGQYRIKKAEECVTCHKDPHKGKPGCQECHSAEGWKKIKVDHSKTRYQLTGKHLDVGCEKCHQKGQLTGLPSGTCESAFCHGDQHKGQFNGKRCDACHSINGWKPSLFNHASNEYRGFKLEGKHAAVQCEKCHANGRYRPVEYRSCETADCHREEHKGQFRGRPCDSCHTTRGWKPSSFDHASSRFKLEGKHSRVKCEKCHLNGHFRPIEHKACDLPGCHNDEHRGQFKARSCDSCHNLEGWKPSTFSHASPGYPGFKLAGRHIDVKCEKCHIAGRFKPVRYGRCDNPDCHQDIHKRKFAGVSCEYCHTVKGWKPSTYDHPEGYTNQGRRHRIPCDKCHDDDNLGIHGGGVPGVPH